MGQVAAFRSRLTPRQRELLRTYLWVHADDCYDDIEERGGLPVEEESSGWWAMFDRLPEAAWGCPVSWRRQFARVFDDLALDLEAGRLPTRVVWPRRSRWRCRWRRHKPSGWMRSTGTTSRSCRRRPVTATGISQPMHWSGTGTSAGTSPRRRTRVAGRNPGSRDLVRPLRWVRSAPGRSWIPALTRIPRRQAERSVHLRCARPEVARTLGLVVWLGSCGEHGEQASNMSTS